MRLGTKIRFVISVVALMSLGMTAGCADDSPDEATKPSAASCLPSRAVFDKVAADHIVTHCGTCHGETPNFGAPNTLTGGYDALIAGEEGQRLVDRIAARMQNKTMPPAASEPIPHQVQDTLVEWASCGTKHPDHSIGLLVDRPVFTAPKESPKNTDFLDFTAGDFAVGENVLDLYQCFTFEASVTEDRFIKRIEVMIDESRVLHHVVLLKDTKNKAKLGQFKCKSMPSGSQYLYAWAPGAGAIEFPEGGMRIKPKGRYILQVHYNNGAGIKNATDNSGVRLYHGPTTGTEYGMVAPGPLLFSIPPNSTTSSTGQCVVKEKTTILAGMPHMHEFGVAFKQEIIRADGSRETLVDLSGWSFEMQPFYSHPATLMPGDRLDTTCTWRNDTDSSVSVGTGTADEMCFNFMFVTPPPKSAYCNSFTIDANADVDYKLGKCATTADAAAGVEVPPRTDSKVSIGSSPTLTGGELGKSRWELTGATLVLPAFAKTYLDIDKSKVVGRGQAWTDGKSLTIDATVRVLVKLKQGDGLDTIDMLSIQGDVVAGKEAGSGTWEPTCGGKEPLNIGWQVKGDELTIRLDKLFTQFTVPAIYTFKRK